MASTDPTPAAPPDATEVIIIREDPAGPGPLDAAPSLAARLGAEAFGTFGLVLVILAVAMYAPLSGAGTLGGAVSAGLVLAGLIVAIGHVSGGHFNPAVSLGAALAGRLSFLDMALYWVSQVFGGVVAAALLYVTVPKELPGLLGSTDTRGFLTTTANGWGEHSPLSTLSGGQVTFDLKAALILEAFATAVFVAVTIGVGARRAPHGAGPFAVGLTLFAMLMVTGPITGGGVNPARSTAAALFSDSAALGQLWLFWLAPLLGAAIVGLFALAFAPATEADLDLGDFDMNDEDDESDEDDEDDEESTS